MNLLHIGPKLPFKLSSSTIVTSPNGQGVMLIGGYSVTENGPTGLDTVIELTAKPFMKWKILEHKLKYPRSRHVALPIPFKMKFNSN